MASTVQERAQEVIDQGNLQPDEQVEGIWWVTSSDGKKNYRVQTTADFVTCTCPFGMHRGALTEEKTCYHAEAVRMAIEEGTR